LPVTALLDLARVLLALSPAARSAVASLARALRDDRPKDARAALELALRLQFVARQNKRKSRR
jgi:hypothetical protein